MYFITKGNIVLIHKKSGTFIKELGTDEYFGEIAFFSRFVSRKVSAKSKNFTEAFTIQKSQFFECLELQEDDDES